MKNEPIIRLQTLSKKFVTDEVETLAVTDLDLAIANGEYVSITGASGCGKSTLLSILGLLDTPTSGHYFLAGHDVSGIDRDERARIRNKEIGFIFQAYNLISDLTVEENVRLPLSYREDLDRAAVSARVESSLEKVDMLHRRRHFPSQLSGGQQQRVAVARAISGNPSVVLADEPTGNLDSKNADAVMDLLDTLHSEGATIVMVTHEPRFAERAQRRVELHDGRMVSDVMLDGKRSAA